MKDSTKYVSFLRGINVGGHHKLPMADLKDEMTAAGFSGVETLLNSGNVIFQTKEEDEVSLEDSISEKLENRFGFKVPVLVRKGEEILQFFNNNPFKEIEITNDLRLYVSFLKQHPQEIELPWISEDQSYKIIEVRDRTVCSVLDVSVTGTTKGMDALERIFGKNITTRNWNTIEKIADRLRI